MAVKKQPAKTPQPSKPQQVRDLEKLIAEAAYYRAQRRGFAPGHELDDWVAAEAEVRRGMQR
jgi:hypothetical protein